ncbi:hypothetical protein VN12_05420 [Pirellula sp. SH-Sr6A]|uniref:SRPBCC family protein n=1 Tax=Pirellula sp. SH-Sr6A TaxID=1632865 RepID=UPI00078EA2BE|nr:SRPBCC domain-containing protein [Pirellula sp. SH-Sr6A]AMV31537.1 hypothetical protein VN12_05420 [Pirellula sp. SH-Sr6A]
MVSGTKPQNSFETSVIERVVEIDAPIEFAFAAILDQLGRDCEMPGGKAFPMHLETWPGGRWFRDLGDNTGHLWGHVQVIKPPTLIEITGPLMMSYAAINHLSYRLSKEGMASKLIFRHQAAGLLNTEHLDGLSLGWEYWIDRVRKLATVKAKDAS